MNTVFGGNRVGGRVELDITGSYPTGLMGALGSYYNDPQELINAQLRYTAAQVDINAQQDSGYSQNNIQIEKTATIAATSLETQIAATNYKNASYEVNYANQRVSDIANVAYTNAHSIYKVCQDASYVAYLTHEASHIVVDKALEAKNIVSVGMSKPDINPIDITTLSNISTLVGNVKQDAHNTVILAQENALQYLFKTRAILSNAIVKSRSVTINLKTVAAFNTLVKTVIKNIADPLNDIAGKETLITQYVPSIPLNNAIQVANIAISCIQAFINANSMGLTNSSTITTCLSESGTLANSLDSIARGKDSIMDLTDATQRQVVQTASTMKVYDSIISIPIDKPYTPYRVNWPIIKEARAAKKVALDADISAVNARSVSDALIFLQTTFNSNITPELSIATAASSSLKMLNDMMACVNKVTANSSAYAAVAITRRASNTVNGLLSQILLEEADSLSAASDSQSVIDLLYIALNNATVTELNVTQETARLVNAATGRAKEIYEKAKNKSYILSRTAHNLVTPQTIAIQTASANNAGRLNNNNYSRLDRNSRNVPVDPPAAYKSFQAEIRAKTFQPIRPTLDELVYKNRLSPLTLDSLRTILDTKIKVAKDVQHINDISAFSFKK